MTTAVPARRTVQTTRCDFYTDRRMTTGFIKRSHARFSDTMNAVNQDFMPVWDSDVREIAGPQPRSESAAEVLVRRRSIILVAPQERRAGRELSAEQKAMQAGRTRVEAVIDAGPYRIQGILHLRLGVDLLQHVHDGTRGFMEVTDARVDCRNSPEFSFVVPFLLVNRYCVDVAYEAAAHGRRADVCAGGDLHRASEMPVDPAAAARALAATPVFQRAEFARLEALCRDLCAAGNIASIRFGPRSEIFHQGDTGKALYVVVEGAVESVRTDQAAREAPVGPGSIVGEMTAISDEPRTVTARTMVESVLLAVHQEAARVLLAAFPMASTGLLKLAIDRNGGLVQRRLSLRTGSFGT